MISIFDISELTDTTLDELRHQTDPLVDNLGHLLLAEAKGSLPRILKKLSAAEQYNRGDFTEFGIEISNLLDQYFTSTCDLPEWIDRDRIQKGEKVFSIYGPAILMLLNLSALPICYSCANGAKVLYETGRLMHSPKGPALVSKRLMDTAHMVIKLMLPGGLSANGGGVFTIQKVRLLHSMMRHYLKNKKNAEPWDVETYGEPINQEDMSGTLMAFSTVVLHGLNSLKASLDRSDLDAYMHVWKVAGYLMGIDQRLLPDNYEDGLLLSKRILNRQARASIEGEQLTKSCLETTKSLVGINIFKEMPHYLSFYLISDFSDSVGVNLCKCIDLNYKIGSRKRVLIEATQYLFGKLDSINRKTFLWTGVAKFNLLLFKSTIRLFLNKENNTIHIPYHIMRQWLSETEVSKNDNIAVYK